MKGFWIDVTIEGLNLERLLSAAGRKGIDFRRLHRRTGRRMQLLVRETALTSVAAMAQEGGWSLTVGRRHGLGRAYDLFVRHQLLAAALGLTLIVCFFVTQVMWRVVLVDAGAYAADVHEYLEALGVKPVMWKHDVDLSLLRDRLEWRYPTVARVDCGWRGMTLRICLAEGTADGTPRTIKGSGDVTASRAGIVDTVITYAGTPVVKKGDLVMPGQVLIQGEERDEKGTATTVRASGSVMARVWDGAQIRMPLWEQETIYTGCHALCETIECPWFDLWTLDSPAYAHQDVSIVKQPLGGLFIPLTLRSETHLEAEITPRRRELDQVKAEAGIAALRTLRSRIGFDVLLLDKWIEYSIIDDEELCAAAIGEHLIDIAE